MSRIPKRKIEKTKVKAVFRLQFQATHIPQPGWDKLFVSFIPTDSGKVTSKTSKASVRNGSCKWSDPIYETTRLLQDPKTKDYEEKLYKLVVAMGSSRSSLLGEVIINLTDFVDALKPSSAALPLHGCDFGTILHMTVQLLTSKTGFREFEQQRELSVKSVQASSGKKCHDQNKDSPATSGASERIDKVNARFRFKGDSTGLPSLEEVGELDEEYEDSAAGIDGSSYTSDSLYAEKNDFSGSTEHNGLKGRVSGDVIECTTVHSSSTEKGDHTYKHLSTQLSNDWSHGWSSDYSIDNDLASTCDDNDKLTSRLQVAESSVLQLKSEAKSLQNISDELSSETQNLAKQLSVELASGEKMAREVDILKSECWKFKNELDELKYASASAHSSRKKTPSALQMKCFSSENKLVDGAIDAENNNLPSDFQSKLLHGISLIECKAQQIQSKACFGYNGNGFEYIYLEFSVLGSLIQNLKQSIAQELSTEAVSGIQTTKNQYSLVSLSEQHVQVQDDGSRFSDLYYSEGIKEEKVCKLLEQLEVSKTQDESLAKRMAKMECFYEELIHELEDRQKQTSDQLENLRAEHSSCFYTISALQSQTQKSHEELNGQLVQFAEDRHNLESFIKELEKRAISSETMLKRVQWNYAIAVDRLQKDLELLSFQVLSMYEANESLAKQALTDATEQHNDERSEEMKLWHRGESFVSPNQKQQRQCCADIQQDISQINGDHDFSTTLNGISNKFNKKMLYNFSSKEENKGSTETGLSSGLEFHVNGEPNSSVKALKLHDIYSAASVHAIMLERKDPPLTHYSSMGKQGTSCLLHSLNVQLPIDHSQKSNNLENLNDINHYPPPEYSQIDNNTETMRDAYHFPPPENQLLDYIVCSKQIEMSVDVPKQLHVCSGAEFSDVLMLNLQLEIHAQVVQETLREVFPEIGHLKGKIVELQKKMKHCTNNKEFLVLKLHTALDESRTLREVESKCITRYNELESTCHTGEVKLNEALDEKNLLAQELADCHNLIENCRVYESKYKICIVEKNELENLLKEEKSQGAYLQSKVISLIEELKSLKEQYEKKCSLNSDLEKDATDLQRKLGDLCNWIILCNQQFDSILGDISIKEEFDIENYDAIISHLEQFQDKVFCTLLRLQKEKKVAEEQVEVAQCELSERESDILYMKQNFESEMEEVRTKLEFSSTEIKHLQLKLHDALEKVKLSREAEECHRLENRKLLSSISILEVELQQATDECRDFCQKMFETGSVKEEIANSEFGIINLMQENRDLFSSNQSGDEAPVKMEYELSSLKDIFHNAHSMLLRLQQREKVAEEQREVAQCIFNERESHISHMKQKFESELEEVMTKLEHSRTNVQHLHIELQGALEKLKLSKEAEEWHRLENRKLLSNMSVLEVELQQATDKSREFCKKLLSAESVNEELANTKLRLTNLIQEKKDLLSSIQSCNEAFVKMGYELSSLKDSLHYAHDELHSERKNKEDLEVSITKLNLQALDRGRKLDAEFSSLYLEVANMENQLVSAFEHSISADVELTFMRNQFYSKMTEFDVHQKTLINILRELHLKYLDVVSPDKCIASEAEVMAERERLSTDLLSAKSTLEVLFVEKETLLDCIDANTINQIEFEDLKGKAAIFEAYYAKEKQHYENEICFLQNMLPRSEELDELWLTKTELDIMVLFLTSKLSELETHVVLFEECDYELKNLREQHIDLNQKLSEQVLKTEEFKNLSIHLREFREIADAECHQARERKESEGSSFAVQESLRIAFIKEQYESKIQELRNQCSVSRKYAEEMLMKLQSSLNDNETRKRSEAQFAKTNEEMSILLTDLDTELQTVMADRKELIKAYDRMKAELECTILSLECCKEEKQKLQNSLKESSEERDKIRIELDLVKRLLENLASTTGTGDRRIYESDNTDVKLIGELLEDNPYGISFMYDKTSIALGIFSEDKLLEAGRDIASVRVKSGPRREEADMQLSSINGDSFMSAGKTEAAVEQATLLEHNAARIADIKEHFREQQSFINGMELLHKQLQRLKIENFSSEYQLQEDHFDADLQHLHRELSQLDMVNEQLGSIYPTYKKLTSYGNALERVLSLELELAEELQVKKKPGCYVQSSFLKQRGDDEAVFQSFKDINDLIKDMIELKKRNVTVETELQEMHGRYSQLSLQFAEVEGERQKLVMSLKNRTPKRS